MMKTTVIESNKSTFHPPRCISTEGGTTLQVTGFGTITSSPLIEQGTFMLLLLENSVGDNQLIFTAFGFDPNGVTTSISAFHPLADKDFTISFCNSCH